MAWRSVDGGLLAELDEWRRNACEHDRGIYVSRDIGNIALVADLRRELSSIVDLQGPSSYILNRRPAGSSKAEYFLSS